MSLKLQSSPAAKLDNTVRDANNRGLTQMFHYDRGEKLMGGPIVRTGATPEFWANWDKVFGDKKKSNKKRATKATKKTAAKKTAKKKAATRSKKAKKK